MSRKLTTEEFIQKAITIHGEKFDYSKVEYKNNRTDVTIICPIHGEFPRKPDHHLQGQGCRKCSNNEKSQEEFITEAIKVHGNKYDYSKLEYKNTKAKITISCPIHGCFEQRVNSHLAGNGCPKCGIIKAHKPKTTEIFIKKAINIHENKYDYSKVDYKNNKTKVCIICPEHCEFWQTPSNHLKGQGCPECGHLKRRISKKEFLERSEKLHGDRYDYSKVDYSKITEEITIICKIHGEFSQKTHGHLMGRGCPICGGTNRLTTEEFIKKARLVHGDKYDYSNVNYINNRTKISITCHTHKDFLQIAGDHLQGEGCQKCSNHYSPTTEEFIKKARLVHGDKYDYSNVKYINSKLKVDIICREHGLFYQSPNHHLKGSGCQQCFFGSTKKFIEKATIIHNNKYDYSEVNYSSNKEKVIIICPKHGKFKQQPSAHLNGRGCPNCQRSKGEEKIVIFLTQHNINFNSQYIIKNCKYINPLPFDFYLPDYNLLIEYDGEQHFKPIKLKGIDSQNSEEVFKLRQLKDSIKNKFCEENNISLLRIPYWDFKNLEKILEQKLLIN